MLLKIFIKNIDNIVKFNLHFTAAWGITTGQETESGKLSNWLLLNQFLLEASLTLENEDNKILPAIHYNVKVTVLLWLNLKQ